MINNNKFVSQSNARQYFQLYIEFGLNEDVDFTLAVVILLGFKIPFNIFMSSIISAYVM